MAARGREAVGERLNYNKPMLPKSRVCLWLILTMCGFTPGVLEAQDRSSPKPITLFDSDVTPAQKAVLELIQKGAAEDRRGDYNSAIKTFQEALRKLRSLPEMKGDEDGLLVRLGGAYIGARRLDEAIRTFALLLSPGMEDCRQGVTPADCAEAQHYIGFARIQEGNFEAAIPLLTKSMGSYARAASGSFLVESRMINLKKQAEAETWLAAALLRTGHKDRSSESLQHAIAQLQTIEGDAEIQDSIRASARKSLQEARAALKPAQMN